MISGLKQRLEEADLVKDDAYHMSVSLSLSLSLL